MLQRGYPYQIFGLEMQVFYLIESALYLALLFDISRDVKRKDYLEVSLTSAVPVDLLMFPIAEPHPPHLNSFADGPLVEVRYFAHIVPRH